MGLFKDWDCCTQDCPLSSGDTLVLYTDGVTEAFNSSGEEFGESRLIASLRGHRQQSSPDLVAAIIGEVKKFSPHEQSDDITLIAAKSR